MTSDLPTRETMNQLLTAPKPSNHVELAAFIELIVLAKDEVSKAYADGRLIDREVIDREAGLAALRLMPGTERWQTETAIDTIIEALGLGGDDDQ